MNRGTMKSSTGWALLGVLILVSPPALAAKKKKRTKCEVRAERLEKNLDAIPRHVGLGLSPLDIVPPEADGAEMIVARGVLVDVSSQGLAFEGQRLKDGHAALDHVIERIPEVEKLIDAESVPVYVRVDRRTPIDTALAAVCKIAEKRNVKLVVRPPNPPERSYAPPDPPEKIRRMLTSLAMTRSPVARAKALAGEFEKATGTCESVRAAVALVNTVPPEGRAELLKRAVVEGLKTCRCEGADVDSLESLVILMMAPISPPSFAIAPELPCGQTRPMGLKPTLNFDVLVEKLAAR